MEDLIGDITKMFVLETLYDISRYLISGNSTKHLSVNIKLV